MLGPVFQLELLLAARRNRLPVFVWAYTAWLVVQLFYLYTQFLALNDTPAAMVVGYESTPVAAAPSVVGAWFVDVFLLQQMLLLLILTPAFVAGAVTDEKRRGTLQHLLTTDLDARHIVFGKLLGRSAQVAVVLTAGLPFFALMAGFAGVEPVPMLAVLAVLVIPLLALAAVTLLASVWCRQTRDAVLVVYFVGAAGALLVGRVDGPLRVFDPVWVLRPAHVQALSADLAELGRRLALSMAAWGLVGVLCASLATWRLRPVYLRQLEGEGRPGRGGGGARPPIRGNPIRWRERYVEGLAPMSVFRAVPRWLALALVALIGGCAAVLVLLAALPRGSTPEDLLRALTDLDGVRASQLVRGAGTGLLVQGVVAMVLASLVAAIRCSGAVTGERERQTWESLLATPVGVKELLAGKLWGVLGAAFPYLIAYAIPVGLLAALAGPAALLWTVGLLGLTVLAMYFVGAAGLWCSALSRNSWRSLVGTLTVGYGAGALLYATLTPLVSLLPWAGLLLVLAVSDYLFGLDSLAAVRSNRVEWLKVLFAAYCVGLAVTFAVASRLFLSWARQRIATRDRTRHWTLPPVYRRSRRRRAAV